MLHKILNYLVYFLYYLFRMSGYFFWKKSRRRQEFVMYDSAPSNLDPSCPASPSIHFHFCEDNYSQLHDKSRRLVGKQVWPDGDRNICCILFMVHTRMPGWLRLVAKEGMQSAIMTHCCTKPSKNNRKQICNM